MVKKLEEAVVARIRRKGHNFEILVDLEKALKFREGKIKDIREVLVVEEIFKDARKGDRASLELLKDVFKTDNIYEVASIIVKEGDIQITTEYRRKLIEEKKREIISIIHRNAIDPRTKLPIPPTRIEAAIERAGVKIDPFTPVERQIDNVIKKIKIILPLKFEKIKLAVRIKPEHVAKVYGYVKRSYKILKDEWASDGSWIFIVEIPTAMREEFIEKLGNLTRGDFEFKELST